MQKGSSHITKIDGSDLITDKTDLNSKINQAINHFTSKDYEHALRTKIQIPVNNTIVFNSVVSSYLYSLKLKYG